MVTRGQKHTHPSAEEIDGKTRITDVILKGKITRRTYAEHIQYRIVAISSRPRTSDTGRGLKKET